MTSASIPYFFTFSDAIKYCRHQVLRGRRVHTEKWQGYDIAEKTYMEMQEMLNVSFSVQLQDHVIESLPFDIKPNLPWADDHFQERVSGMPLNPGKQWKNWPWSKAAKNSITHQGKFSHTYMSRYWPKFAHIKECQEGALIAGNKVQEMNFMRGIHFDYGDLRDVLHLLALQPLTRQAFLPVWFPEDTGAVHGGRVPCTLGYHFIMRDNRLHVIYYIRSCDFRRHFRDDVYLTMRLLEWVMKELRIYSSSWDDVRFGTFTMHITSLHCFIQDLELLLNED